MNESIKTKIFLYIEQVQCGAKPLAFMSLQTRYIEKAIKLINKKKLYIYVEDVKDYPEWKTIFIYKHEYMLDIIKSLPEYPQTPYEHWIIGKACGYSDEAIGEFIRGEKII